MQLIELLARVQTQGNQHRVQLRWSPADGGSVNILRNGVVRGQQPMTEGLLITSEPKREHSPTRCVKRTRAIARMKSQSKSREAIPSESERHLNKLKTKGHSAKPPGALSQEQFYDIKPRIHLVARAASLLFIVHRGSCHRRRRGRSAPRVLAVRVARLNRRRSRPRLRHGSWNIPRTISRRNFREIAFLQKKCV